jgi:ATP-dependent DNA helicase Rep
MLSDMNTPQREAVKYLDGPLLVLAGAGSGKTRVITRKIGYLVNECGIEPRHIAAITFTNKAAKEMQERASHLLDGRAGRQLNISTFHALGVKLLRIEAKAAGLKPTFSILDASDALSVVQDISKESDKARLRALLSRMSGWKNALLTPAAVAPLVTNEAEAITLRVYEEYERTLRAYQAVDFDDLIGLPARLLETDPDLLARWQSRLRYLLIDEYQDTNRCQYQIVKLLAGSRGAFTAVGDDDQAIYAWRGADVENLRTLQTDYPKLKVIKLEQNYRSMQRILAAANTLISSNQKLFEKKLWSDMGRGDPITLMVARDAEHEAECIAMRIAAHKFEHRGKFGDYAVLYRGNHQARVIETALREQKIPYLVSGGQSFFDRAEIKDVMAYLRLVANSDDDPAFIRAVTTPRRGIGGTSLEALGTYAGERHISLFAALFETGAEHALPARALTPLREFGDFINRLEWRARNEAPRLLLEDLLRGIGYETWLFEQFEPKEAETRWNNVRDFVDWMGRKGEEDGKTLLELTQTVALITMLDKRDDDEARDAVQLSTLHASKGLEYPHVFLVGLEEGILPHRESIEEGRIEEERRLMYVGITRARRTLTLSYCERRRSGRESRDCEPSRFIAEMGEDVQRPNTDAAPKAEQRAANVARLESLKALLGGTPPPKA